MRVTADTPATGHSGWRYRADIDGLRAVAVLLVLASHAAPLRFPRAFIGVDIFFVISGYVITSLIYRERVAGRFQLADFWCRRVLRLFPALLLMLPTVLLAGWFVLLPSAFDDLGLDIMAGAGFAANFLMLDDSYWSVNAAFVPLNHLWSLAVEEQFYLCYPPLLLLVWRCCGERAVAGYIAVLGFASIISLVVLQETTLIAAYCLPISRIWEMLLGAALAWLGRNGAVALPSRPGLQSAVAVIGLGLIIAAIGYPLSEALRFSWPLVVPLACIGAFLVILAGPAALPNRYLLSSRPMVFVGHISYGLYLWHWPLLAFTRQWTGERLLDRLTVLVLLGLALVTASLSYFLVEQPLRRTAPERRGRVALALVGGLAVIAAAGGIVQASGGFPERFPLAVRQIDEAASSRAVPKAARCFQSIDERPERIAASCEQSRGPAGRTDIAFWGDSHVGVLESAIRERGRDDGLAISIFARGACPPLLDPAAQRLARCRRFNDLVFARLRANPPNLVVLTAHWDTYRRPGGAAPDWAVRLDQTIRRLTAIGVRHVLVLGNTPFWPKPLPRLLIPDLMHRPEASVPQHLDRREAINLDETDLSTVAGGAGAVFLPLLPVLCSTEHCRVAIGGDLLQSDTDHLTPLGVRHVFHTVWPKILDLAVPPTEVPPR